MKTPVAYTYVVASRRKRTSRKWSLAILYPDGVADTLTSYTTRAKAIGAARILAGASGIVEVRP